MRAYLASPYSAFDGGPDAAYAAALGKLVRICDREDTVILPLFWWGDRSPGIWSPVVEGHLEMRKLERDKGAAAARKEWQWQKAMHWCLSRLRAGHFDTLIVADLPGVEESRGVHREIREATALGLTVTHERV